MSAFIEISKASLTFSVYRNRAPKLRECLLELPDHNERALNSALKFVALQDMSLAIYEGQRVGIIGFNGAGKSTLLKLILGIYHPDSGQVRVSGTVAPVLDLGGHFDFELSGRDNIFLHGAYLGHSPREIRAIEREVLAFAEIADFIDVPVKYYSSGMIARLAFAISTMLHAEILLLDEVFAVGDGYFVQKSIDRMKALINKAQIMIMVSHNVDHLREVCTRIIWLHQGRIVGDGKVDEMLAAYKTFIDRRSNGDLNCQPPAAACLLL
jgi:ABC-type polysaccharide/polyol phosphate transport system ATPase subunit